jgi:prepilin-type N-terminal cleavage/methylation domain-containing protein
MQDLLYVKKAFSLAEVLITLLVIGVVAGLTIPAIINDTQEKEFQTAYKKKYAEFSQAFTLMRMDNGGTLAGMFAANHTVFETTLRKYMNLTHYSSTDNLNVNADWHDNCFYKTLNNQTGTKICGGCPSATLADGSFFYVYLSWGNNDLLNCNYNGASARTGLCFDIILDVNGRKSPNVMGKDIYILSVYKEKTIPGDWTNSGAILESTCDISNTGDGCAIKYLK